MGIFNLHFNSLFFWFSFQLRQALTPLEVMGALFGSAMHDLDHPGVNQKYLINSKHFLADLYQVTFNLWPLSLL